MSKTIRWAAEGSRKLLNHILDERDLPAQIQALPPSALGKLVDHVGLEDAGELVALASTEQLAHMFDEDLWRTDRPGEDEHFDPARMLIWLNVMMEAGDGFVAQKLAELPEDLVTLALHKVILVVSTESLSSEMEDAGEDAEQLDKALSNCLYEDLDEYQLIARNVEGWDTVLAAILALDRDHHALLARILDRCHHMSASDIDDQGGLYSVLTSEQMLETDVAGEREDRRAASGHVSPSAARSFLALASAKDAPPPTEQDAATRAYFRALSPLAPRPEQRKRPAGDGVFRLLEEFGVAGLEQAMPRLLAAGEPGGVHAEPLLIQAMRLFGEVDSALFAKRTEEVAYLANVLVSACGFQGRRLRPIEGVHAALATCSLGLWLLLGGDVAPSVASAEAAKLLKTHPADGLFRVGFRALLTDVKAPAAELRSEARGANGPLSAPDVKAAIRGLADDCPHLAGQLRIAGRSEPQFLSTLADLKLAQTFLAQSAAPVDGALG